MSSIRSRKRPSARCAHSLLSIAESAWPRCNSPFGLGAKRKTGLLIADKGGLKVPCTDCYGEPMHGTRATTRRIASLDDISAGLDELCRDRSAACRHSRSLPARFRSGGPSPGFAASPRSSCRSRCRRRARGRSSAASTKLVDPLTAEGVLAAERRDVPRGRPVATEAEGAARRRSGGCGRPRSRSSRDARCAGSDRADGRRARHRAVDGRSAICFSPPAIPTSFPRATSRCRPRSAMRSEWRCGRARKR